MGEKRQNPAQVAGERYRFRRKGEALDGYKVQKVQTVSPWWDVYGTTGEGGGVWG